VLDAVVEVHGPLDDARPQRHALGRDVRQLGGIGGAAQAHVGLDALHLRHLDARLGAQLRLGRPAQQLAVHRHAPERHDRDRLRRVDRVDEIEHEPIGDVERLDEACLAGWSRVECRTMSWASWALRGSRMDPSGRRGGSSRAG
jgi:hypothetical protein